MKCFRRYCCVLLCLVSLLGLFSVPVSAESIETSNLKVNVYNELVGKTTNTFGQTDLDNGTNGSKSVTSNYTLTDHDYKFQTRLTIADKAGTPILRKGETYTITIDNLYFNILVAPDTGYHTRIKEPEYIYNFRGIDAGNNLYDFNVSDCTLEYYTTKETYSITAKVTPTTDIYRLYFRLRSDYNPKLWEQAGYPSAIDRPHDITWDFGVKETSAFKLDIDVRSEEAGLLDGILGWIKNIFNTITDTFNAILELPAKLWGLIENGLKGLFVPDAEYMASYKDKWDELLARKFGAVYEVANITFESWDKITNSDETNTINLPNVSIPISNGQTFTFGGYDVQIVPNGFDWLVTMIKALTGGLCTILFVNGLRKRYDEIMGVEK